MKKRCCVEIEEILNSNDEIDYLIVYFGDCSSVIILIFYIIFNFPKKIDAKEELQAFNEYLSCPKSATINSYYSNLVITAIIEKIGFLKCIDYAAKALENDKFEAPPLQRFIDVLIEDNIFTLESITKLAREEIAKHSSKLLNPNFHPSNSQHNIYDLLFTAAIHSSKKEREVAYVNRRDTFRLSQDSHMIDAHSYNKTKNNFYGKKVQGGEETIKESCTVSDLAVSSYSVATNYLQDDSDNEEDYYDISRSRRVSQINLSLKKEKAIHSNLYSNSLDQNFLK